MSGEYFEGGYPPPAFYFTVTFGDGIKVPDASFSEVSGIGIEMETESVVEGGENRSSTNSRKVSNILIWN